MKKMKERTYGWYPSVRDVYISKNQPTPYHLECLYKFQQSGYYNPIAEPPQPAFVIRGISPSPPSTRPATARAPSRQGSQATSRRPKSVPVPKFRPIPKMTIPTPMQAWGRHAPQETAWGVVTPGSTPNPQATSAKCENREKEEERSPQLEWPTQHAVGKYDKPYVVTSTAVNAAEEVFGTPMPPREPDTGDDSGYVFIPTGDGGVEVHSPPPIYWPDTHPRPPSSPQNAPASSKASVTSSQGASARRKLQEQQRQQELEEKKKVMDRQRRYDKLLRQQQLQQQQAMQRQQSETPKSMAGGASTVRRERVKSATTHRAKPPTPQRPAFSARPASNAAGMTPRHQGKVPSPSPRCSQQYKQTVITPPCSTDIPVDRTPWGEDGWEPPSTHGRPAHPVPPSPSMEDLVIEEDRSPSPTYHDVVDNYGWRAEVHGDPYGIKKTTKRLPYSVKCTEPVLAPEPPKVHMESKETFFLNTIPRRKATFDVHREWLSEGLHAKRIELQKREGLNYRYKTFSFAY